MTATPDRSGSDSVDLVVDGGATSLRMGVVDSDARASDALRSDGPGRDAVSRLVEVPGFQWRGGADPVEQQRDRVRAAWEALGRPGPVGVVALGLAGGAADLPSRRRLAPLVADALGARRVYATGDDVTTHLGVLGGSAGVVVAAGTGTLCLAVTPDGRLVNVDGLGYLFGDLGSGFSLGLAGVRAALAALELRGPRTSLLARATAVVGEPLRDSVKRLYHSDTLVAQVAAFAAEVVDAAADDEVAARLCAHAGGDLASDVASALAQGFPDAGPAEVPVSWSGSVLRSAPPVFDAFTATLAARCPQALPTRPRGDSLRGAVRLASGAAVPHLANVVRHSREASTS